MANTEPLQQDRLIALSEVAAQDLPAGSLYVVGMPIGNAADITLRALWVLAHVDVIAAEDTRVTRPLLARYGITTPLMQAHQHNEREAAARIAERLARGERVALVSDAGTPGVSDPGAIIVRAALDAGQRVVPIPGASSVVSALSVSALAAGPFTFVGFLPTGARERERTLRAVNAEARPFLLFEAPHRIAGLIALLARVLQPDRRVVLMRELSKKFETISSHQASELVPLSIEERGEYVVLVDAAPATTGTEPIDIDPSLAQWLTALLEEMPPTRAAAIAARASGKPKQALYALALQLKSG
jgi:16S rRNA (cytidine1402-2'-O)-methyltransferase